jgi:hypothetical protein
MRHLEQTNLYLADNSEKVEGYTFLGTYFDYDFDFDIRPYIKESILKDVEPYFGGDVTKDVTHFYDYQSEEYHFMLNDGHSFQTLLMVNEVEFEDDITYNIYERDIN